MNQRSILDLRVLLVDDHDFVLSHTTRILGNLGVSKIRTARSGQEALEVLDTAGEPPQLIFIDINMSDMDGVELLRHLGMRVNMMELQLSVVFVSGMDERILHTAEALGRSHNLHVLGSIRKPVKSHAVEKLLRDYEPTGHVARKAATPSLTREELVQGIGSSQVILHYQPKVALEDGRCTGVEALARWQHPQRGLLGPDAFIPLAEELGLIDALTENVIGQAFEQCARWRNEGVDLRIAVNYSIDSLANLIQPDFIADVARLYGIGLDKLTIEVTESLVMHDSAVVTEVLTRLRLQGVGLALDDFGTRYAVMERLQQIPFTELKLDKSYVTMAHADPVSRAILESSLVLGRRLGLNVIAEGVEDKECWDLMRQLGCDEVQGYFIARPMPGAMIVPWLGQWESTLAPAD